MRPCETHSDTSLLIKGYIGSEAELCANQRGIEFESLGVSPVSTNKKEEFVISNGILVKYNGEGGDIVIPNTVTEIHPRVFPARLQM